MDIHKPKPIRNWRDFLKEYAIIVLGVATALAGEQAVEWWHWRHEVELGRNAIAWTNRTLLIATTLVACGCGWFTAKVAKAAFLKKAITASQNKRSSSMIRSFLPLGSIIFPLQARLW